VFPFLAKLRFRHIFHRAILIAAVLLLWPLLRVSNVPGLPPWALRPIRIVDAMLAPESCSRSFPALLRRFAHWNAFLLISATSCLARLGKVLLAAISVPFIEETFFRESSWASYSGLVRKLLSVVAVSALLQRCFLEGIGMEPAIVTMDSGSNPSRRLRGFGDPMMVLGALPRYF